MGKAGGYGIQGPAALFVESIEGDYNNIFGLPAAHVMQEAKKLLKADKNIRQARSVLFGVYWRIGKD